ncbi:MAG TPA: hypothetical protein V6C97_26410 [Oculatellaceae cyanobacterium]
MNLVHVHLLLNHVPVIGVILGMLLLATSLIRKNAEWMKAALGIFLISGLIGVPVFLTGESAEEAVEGRMGVSEAVIEKHEDSAKPAMILLQVLAAAALVSMFLVRGTPTLSRMRSVSMLLIALSLVTTLFAGRAANLGGQIRHPEIGTTLEQPVDIESEAEHED